MLCEARRLPPSHVAVRLDEAEDVRRQAAAAYLHDVGLSYRVSGIVDCQQACKLARINGDLGRPRRRARALAHQ